MTRTLEEKIKQLPKARQAKIKDRAAALIADEATLREIRQALALTQEELGAKLDVKQEAISRLEKRTDLLLSTLGSYIQAMGGELSITVDFPDRKSVKLTGLVGLKNNKA